MAAVVVLFWGFDVGVSKFRDGLFWGGPEADGQVGGRRMEEGRCLLLWARVRENQLSMVSLVAKDHPAYRTPRQSAGPDVAQML